MGAKGTRIPTSPFLDGRLKSPSSCKRGPTAVSLVGAYMHSLRGGERERVGNLW